MVTDGVEAADKTPPRGGEGVVERQVEEVKVGGFGGERCSLLVEEARLLCEPGSMVVLCKSGIVLSIFTCGIPEKRERNSANLAE